jgi:tetratricopeptide (TPR) repeat protein
MSTLGQAASTVSANRKSDPHRLRQFLRGEVDWIVMKALEKDRNRRYETASAFAADVQRYLHDEPVQACPPSRWYKFRKFARRNRGPLLSASAVVLAVLVATVALAVSNVLIRHEQSRTQEEKDRAERELEALKTAYILLDRGQWYVGQLRWDDAHAAFTKALALRPEHVSVWTERGDLYTRLGLWDLAGEDFAQGFALRVPDTSSRWFQHALLRQYLGDTDGCRQVCRRMRERFRGSLDKIIIEDTIRASVLVPDADADLEAILQLARLNQANDSGTSHALYLLGLAHYRSGQYAEAERRLRESLTARAGLPVPVLGYPVLALAHHRLGQTAKARQALDAAAKTLDRWTQEMYRAKDGMHWVTHLGAEASWPVAWWDWVEFQLYYRDAGVAITGSAPPEDPRLHILRARSFAGLHWNSKAEVEYAAALKLHPDDPQVQLEAHRNWAYVCIGHRQWDEVAAAFGRASQLQPEDAYLWKFRAVAHLAAGDVGLYRQCCAAMLKHFEKTEDHGAASSVVFACVLRDDALPDMSRLLPLARVGVPAWDPGSKEYGAALYRRQIRRGDPLLRGESAVLLPPSLGLVLPGDGAPPLGTHQRGAPLPGPGRALDRRG